jgi:hypothetical protein
MSISWGTGWYVYSTHKNYDEEHEKMYVEDMIENSYSADVRKYYKSKSGGQVYVKTGLHTSLSEQRVHITLQLGLDKPPWQDLTWPARTAHVMDLIMPETKKFATDVFDAFTKDSKEKIAKTIGKT